MSRDELQVVLLVAAFATFVTVHVALVAGLASRSPRWRSLVALPVLPLAPYWGIRAEMYARVVLWLASAAAYVALRVTSK